MYINKYDDMRIIKFRFPCFYKTGRRYRYIFGFGYMGSTIWSSLMDDIKRGLGLDFWIGADGLGLNLMVFNRDFTIELFGMEYDERLLSRELEVG